MAEYRGKFSGEQIDERLSLAEQVPKKADKNGKYSNMTVGFAENLIGRGDTQEAYINFRPSAGADTNITDGAARIKKIKGNSVVWNQLVNGIFTIENLDGISTRYDEGTKEIVLENISQGHNYSSGSFRNGFNPQIYTIPNHKYIAFINKDHRGIALVEAGSYIVHPTGTIFSTTSSEQLALRITSEFDFASQCPIGEQIRYKLAIVDLTKMFGVGNEPISYEEYLQRRPMNIDEYAYNKGEIISVKVEALNSVGNNAYDDTKGYARVIGGKEYAFDGELSEVEFSTTIEGTKESISIASGDKYTFAENGYAWLSGKDIYVCLHHSYGKPITPYEDDTLGLAWVRNIKDDEGNALFPNGMRSAGTGFDEIRYNRTTNKWEAVKRIGEVDLGLQNWSIAYSYNSDVYNWRFNLQGSNAATNDKISNIVANNMVVDSADNVYLRKQVGSIALAYNSNGNYVQVSHELTAEGDKTAFINSMQGQILYYELAEPIVVEIPNSENFNLDYLVWDFGTEEAIAIVPSAPFRADINYEFNAVDDIRWAHSKIKELLADIELLKANQTSSTLVE